MSQRHEDWLAQARRDLKAAQDSLNDSNYEWATFQSQQAAEKALKGLLRFHNVESTGHTLSYLLRQVESCTPVSSDYWPMVRELDRHYIQTRYPNGFAAGYPGQFYDDVTARRCVEYAEQLVTFALGQVGTLP